jgi:hypothetical protein
VPGAAPMGGRRDRPFRRRGSRARHDGPHEHAVRERSPARPERVACSIAAGSNETPATKGGELLVERAGERWRATSPTVRGPTVPAPSGSSASARSREGTDSGHRLLAAAMAAESAAGRSLLRVVTHGGDTASMAMYQSAGFPGRVSPGVAPLHRSRSIRSR